MEFLGDMGFYRFYLLLAIFVSSIVLYFTSKFFKVELKFVKTLLISLVIFLITTFSYKLFLIIAKFLPRIINNWLPIIFAFILFIISLIWIVKLDWKNSLKIGLPWYIITYLINELLFRMILSVMMLGPY